MPPVIDPSAGASAARSADTATCPAGRYLPRQAGGRAVDSRPWRAPIAAALLLLLLVVVLADSAGWPGRRCVSPPPLHCCACSRHVASPRFMELVH